LKSIRQPLKHGKTVFGTWLPVRQIVNLAVLAALSPLTLYANPDGAHIISGHVGIDTSTPGVTTVTNSPNAIIQWQNFNIAQDEITRFIQQNSQSAVLNRIIGENPSQILGQLISNGKVLLINPNGIVFGADSVIDTQGLVASSLNLSDEDFLKGNYHFMAGSSAGAIVNEGLIRAGKDGNIILIAPSITNNGIIKSEGGQITLAAGQELILTNLDDPDIRFEIQAPADTVLNLGKLLTEGGAVNVFASTIKHQGEINVDSVEVDSQGHVRLVAQQDITLAENSKVSANNSHGDAGTVLLESKTGSVTVAGTVQADAVAGKGGTVQILGEQVALLTKARVDAGGGQGGGEVLVGGDRQGKNAQVHNAQATFVAADAQIHADAKTQGNGGKVVIWADKSTRAYGQISAKGGSQGGNGGFVETSGHFLDASGIQVDASAAHGKGGQWLLDPSNITIQQRGSDTHLKDGPNWTNDGGEGWLTTGSVEAALNAGTSVKVMTGTDGSQDGNITVLNQIIKSAGGAATLTLEAHNDITIDAAIRVAKGSDSGALSVWLTPDSDSSGEGSAAVNQLIDLNGGTLTFDGNGIINGDHTGVLSNADLAIVKGAVQADGLLVSVGEVTVGQGTTLTLNHGAVIGTLSNSGTLNNNAYLGMETLNLYSGAVLQGSGVVDVTQAFNFYAGANLAGTGTLVTEAKTTTTLKDSGTLTLAKQWNNKGTVVWQQALTLTGSGTFNNFSGGVINMATDGAGEIATTVFNNDGAVNLSGGGSLTITAASGHSDTGSYVADSGSALYFSSQNRTFGTGASVTADAAKVVFTDGGEYRFVSGSHYQAAETDIDGASLSFKTGSTLVLPIVSISNNASLTSKDDVEISQSLGFSSGYFLGNGLLTTQAGSTTTLADGSAGLYKNWANYGQVNFGVIAGTNPLNNGSTLASVKNWDNYGTIVWQGAAADNNSLASQIILTNQASGIISFTGTGAGSVRQITLGQFNNNGRVNIADGSVQITSDGADTGSYHIAATGQLQFQDGTRVFKGANISSETPVSFSNDKVFVTGNTVLDAPETVLDGSTFNLYSALSLGKLTMTGGVLDNTDSLTTSSQFSWSGGTLAGAGHYQFANGFAYSGGVMAATGTVQISDYSGLLTLPAMPSVNRLTAKSSGQLLLTGDITANGGDSAIVLVADTQFINDAGAKLATPHGRWLVYSTAPDTTVLGGLMAKFSHYGCTFGSLCRDDGFNVAAAMGNGVLYSASAVLPDGTVSQESAKEQNETLVLLGSSPSGSVAGTFGPVSSGPVVIATDGEDDVNLGNTAIGAVRAAGHKPQKQCN